MLPNKRKREGEDDEDYNSSNQGKKYQGSSNSTFVNEEMSDCLQLLETLSKEEIAGPFLMPVDWKELNLPQYPEIIKNPMDLGSIREMLLRNTLANPEHFAIHVRLVFNNALLFNLEESQVAQYAKKLLNQFETLYTEMLSRWRKEVSQKGDQNQQEIDKEREREREKEKEALQKKVDTINSEIETMRQQVNELKRKRGLMNKATTETKKVKLTRPKAPLTIKQKEDLCQKIGELGEDDFPGLISLVDPDASEDTEFTLNFAVLDDQTILNIQKYVQDCAKAKKKKNGQKRKSSGYK